jgi:hypothetical protein
MSTTRTITEEKAMRMLNPIHPGRLLRTEITNAHGLFRDRSCENSWSIPSNPFQSPERQSRSFRGNGPTIREGLRGRDGYPDADAEFLEHCPNSTPGERDSRGALRAAACGLKERLNGTAKASAISRASSFLLPTGFLAPVVTLKAGGVFNVSHSDLGPVCPACRP